MGVVAGRRSRLVAEFFVSDLDAIDAAQAQLRLPPQVFEEAVSSDELAGIGLAGPKLLIWAFVGTFRERIAPQHSVDTAPHLRQGT